MLKWGALITAVLISVLLVYSILVIFISATGDQCEGGMFTFRLFGSEIHSMSCKTMNIAEVGNYFAGMMAPLIVIWLVVGFIWQASELSQQVLQFRLATHQIERVAIMEEKWHRRRHFYSLLDTLCGQVIDLEKNHTSLVHQLHKQFRMESGGAHHSILERLLQYKEPQSRQGGVVANSPEFFSSIDKLYDIAVVLCDLLVASKSELKDDEDGKSGLKSIDYDVTRNTKLVSVLERLYSHQ